MTGYAVAYWNKAITLAGNPSPTWVSTELGGPACARCLDMSDDGNYVVVGLDTLGEPSVFGIDFWTGAKGLNTFPEGQKPTAWAAEGAAITSVDMSGDGNYVAAGVFKKNAGVVAYLKNARTLTGYIENANWLSPVDGRVDDVAISDDGNYVAAATAGLPDTVYYWAGAGSRGLNEAAGETPTWEGETGVSFTSIDMSSDGNSVIAGASSGVYFWGGARGLTGKPQNPSWTYTTTSTVHDVAINAAGNYMAAANDVATSLAYFFDNTGALKWSYLLDNPVSYISMSADGATLAVGTGLIGTAYLFDTGFPIHVVGAPVGGFMEPVNKLAVFAPYLALFGIVATVAVVVVKPWKKREN